LRIQKICDKCLQTFWAKHPKARYCPTCRAIKQRTATKKDDNGLFIKYCKDCKIEFRTAAKTQCYCEPCRKERDRISWRKAKRRQRMKEKITQIV